MTDYDKRSFLKETLAGGRIDGAEVLRMADATGIKRADLNKAKRDIGVDTAQTGYGKIKDMVDFCLSQKKKGASLRPGQWYTGLLARDEERFDNRLLCRWRWGKRRN